MCYNFSMGQQYIGAIIKEFRKRKNLTQDDLCIGDLDTVTISRIENGHTMPQLGVIKQIFARLGLKTPMNMVSVTDEEYDKYILQEQIEEAEKNDLDFLELLEKFKDNPVGMDAFDWQFYFSYKALCLEKGQCDKAELLDLYLSAIKETLPSFSTDANFKKRNYYTSNELLCIYKIACLMLNTQNRKQAYKLFQFLYDYMQCENIDEDEKDKYFAVVILNLCKCKEEANAFESALKLAEQGIDFLIEKDILDKLTDLLYIKAKMEIILGRSEASLKSLRPMFIILRYQKKQSQIDELRAELKNKYNYILPDWITA